MWTNRYREVMIKTMGNEEIMNGLQALLKMAEDADPDAFRASLTVNGEPATIDALSGLGEQDMIGFRLKSDDKALPEKLSVLMALVEGTPGCGAVVKNAVEQNDGFECREDRDGMWIDTYGTVIEKPIAPDTCRWKSYGWLELGALYQGEAARELFERYKDAVDYEFMMDEVLGWGRLVFGEAPVGLTPEEYVFDRIDFETGSAEYSYTTKAFIVGGTLKELHRDAEALGRMLAHVDQNDGEITVICNAASWDTAGTGSFRWISEEGFCQLECTYKDGRFGDFRATAYSL